MSSPFDAPSNDATVADDSLPPLRGPLEDPHLLVTIVLLMMYGIPLIGFALLFPPVGFIGGLLDPEFQDIPGGFLIMGCIGTIEGLCMGIMGALYIASAVGLLRGRKWAWVLALCASAIWMSSPCCLPVGGYCLFALLRERVRRAYGIM